MKFFDYIKKELDSRADSNFGKILKGCSLIGFIAAGAGAGYAAYPSNTLTGTILIGWFAGIGGTIAGFALSSCSYISFHACKNYLSDMVEETQEERAFAQEISKWKSVTEQAKDFLLGKPAKTNVINSSKVDIEEGLENDPSAALFRPVKAPSTPNYGTIIENKSLLEYAKKPEGNNLEV
jgi:hypothetical protein